MSNQSHTPGPWHVKWERNSVYIRSADPDRNLSICRVMTHRNHNNTNILVHAPEMLRILEELTQSWVRWEAPDLADAMNEAKEIIKTIKGDNNA